MFIDELQYKVQELVDRKKTSSYYTTPDGLAVIRQLVKEVDRREGIVLMDPFMGSGVTLSSVSDLVRPSKVIGIEVNRAPCELGRRVLSSLYSDVEVVCDDAFRVGWRYRADLIITNPPFVRWHLIEDRDEVLEAVVSHGYKDYVMRRDPGLHILSFFLMDYILRAGGYAIAVLPASTFYTAQGSGLKRLLRRNYDVLAIVENLREPSFSDGSGFKELIVFLRKRPLPLGDALTSVYQYDGNLRKLYSVSLARLPRLMDRNWLSLFDYERAERLVKVIERGLEEGLLRYLRRDEIVRGVEMYGPEFFFIPNRTWSVVGEDENHVVIRGPGTLRIPRRYLVKCLRRPEHYSERVVIRDPGFYVLAIGDEPQGDLRKYVEWGEREGVPALRLGDRWYQHIWRQLQTKRPYGHIFIHDKVDLTRNRVLANYSEAPLCASKNFYVIRTDNPLIAAWLNSSIMREVLEVFSKRISSSWTRLLEDDYLAIPVPSRRVSVNLDDTEATERTVRGYLGIS